jgi:predicted murein hydrolase (TIGR00659 family)
LLTILAFLGAIRLNRYLKSSILNPFVLALLFILGTLFATNISYETYYQGNQPLTSLLNLAIVTLALPFYEQFPQVRKKWKEIVIICTFSGIFTMLSGMVLALLFGGDQEIVASMAGKSVTMPIALLIDKEVGGNPALTAIGVMIAGLTGAICGISLLRLLGLHDPKVIGLGMGAISHALGTVRCFDESEETGSYSAIAFILCGVLSAFIAPLAYRLTLILL